MVQKLTQEDWEQMEAGRAQVCAGDFKNALAIFSSIRSRTTDPRELSAILLNEAQCYRVLRRFEEAHAACDHALDLSKDNDEGAISGWIVKTDILVDERRFSDALRVIETSLRRYPDLERSQQLLRKAELMVYEGEHAEAIDILKHLLKSADLDEGDIATIHHKVGVSYGALGEFGDATEHLLTAQSPQLSKEYLANNSFWLAKAAATRGDFGSTKNHLLKALAAAEHSDFILLAELYESLANVSRELGDEADAAKYDKLWQASNR